jgi:hypothetical protein
MAKVDRDAAIAVLFHRYEQAAQRWKESGEAREFGAMVELDRAGLELSRLPVEEDRPAFRWIPISEAAPERGRDVLVQMKDGRILNGWVFDDEEMDWFLGTGERYAHNDEIIAWAPLPEPYKEERDG